MLPKSGATSHWPHPLRQLCYRSVCLSFFFHFKVSDWASSSPTALQLAPKKNPEMLDRFVVCQAPRNTEGEDPLRCTRVVSYGKAYSGFYKLEGDAVL
jgi:hypothetical protein